MEKCELAIQDIGNLICSAMATDKLMRIKANKICYSGTINDFEEIVTRSLNAALQLVDYHDVFDIAMGLQRQEMKLKGFDVLDHYHGDASMKRGS